jgi:hypothetical protein
MTYSLPSRSESLYCAFQAWKAWIRLPSAMFSGEVKFPLFTYQYYSYMLRRF